MLDVARVAVVQFARQTKIGADHPRCHVGHHLLESVRLVAEPAAKFPPESVSCAGRVPFMPISA